MFKREVSKNTGENYCPVVESANAEKNAPTETRIAAERGSEVRDRPSEIFVLAANIYYRARRNTRARAAGIL